MKKTYLVLLCKKLRSCYTSIVTGNTNVQQIRRYKMAVRQLPKEKTTKDGRHWCFYDRIKVNGLTKLYVSKNYMTKAEAIKAERDFLVGLTKKF